MKEKEEDTKTEVPKSVKSDSGKKYELICRIRRRFEINIGKTNLIWKGGVLLNGDDFKDGIPEKLFNRYFSNHKDYFEIKEK